MKDIKKQKSRQPNIRQTREYQIAANGRRHRRRRKKRLTLYYILILMFVLVAGIILSVTVFFNIKEIRVEGDLPYSAAEIIEKSKVQTGDNLFRISVGKVKSSIQDALPYVEEVKVRRDLRGVLILTVQQAVPYMNLEYDGTYMLLSEKGRILESGASTPYQDKMVVSGVTPSATNVGAYISFEDEQTALMQNILRTLQNVELTDVDHIDLTDRASIKLSYDNGRIQIRLGTENDMEHKLRLAKECIRSKIGENEKVLLNVSTVGSATIRPIDDDDTGTE